VLVLLVVGLGASLSAGCFYSSNFSSYKTPAGAQRAVAQSYLPSVLDIPGRYHGGGARMFRARIYVDQDYRHRPHWKDHAANLVRASNAYTAAAFGVALEVTFVDWERTSPGQDLRVILQELEDLDAGADADWIIGLCAAPATFTASHHELGMAIELGKHFVVRDMNDAAEIRQIAEVYDQMSDRERLALYAARKAHKELAVFLHEWAHTLGALHERGDGRLMSPAYTREASTFSEADAGLVEHGLAIRDVIGDSPAAQKERAAAQARMLAFVQANAGWEEWFDEEKTQLVRDLGGDPGVVAGAGAGAGAATKPAAVATPASGMVRMNLPRAALLAYNRAVEATNRGDHAKAWDELEPIVTSFPDATEVQRMACRLGVLEVGGEEALAACAQVMRLDPADAEAPLWEANARARAAAPDDARVQALLDAAEARLARKADAEARETWVELARVAYSVGALTSAEHALAHLGKDAEANELRDSVRDARRLTGLPPEGARVGVPRAQEAAYFRAFKVAYEKVLAGEARFARDVVDAQLAHFPEAPGLLALACGVEASAHHGAKARKLCARALAGWDDTTLAHFFAAEVATSAAEAIPHLERVIALDPAQKSAWVSLGGRYDQTGATEKKRALVASYASRFHETLPMP
jgi:tetratricopeptide (TPR) repeat protein